MSVEQIRVFVEGAESPTEAVAALLESACRICEQYGRDPVEVLERVALQIRRERAGIAPVVEVAVTSPGGCA